jgi:GH24 family phage-related lysozyme (muramidase)
MAPWLGRWTSADPAGMVDGPGLYTYVRGNPLMRVDPLGLWGKPVASPAPAARVNVPEAAPPPALERVLPPETPSPKPPEPPTVVKSNGPQKVSEKAVEWVRAQETWHNNPIALGATVGWGHKIVSPKDLERLEKRYGAGKVIPKGDAQAEALLRGDLNGQLETLAKMVKTPLTQQQADALAIIGFNGALFNNKELIGKIKAGAKPEVIAEHFFDRVNTSEGKGGVETGKPAAPSLGLLQRRIGEARIFLLGRYEQKSDELRKLGSELLVERAEGRRAPAIQRVLTLPSYNEVKASK